MDSSGSVWAPGVVVYSCYDVMHALTSTSNKSKLACLILIDLLTTALSFLKVETYSMMPLLPASAVE